MLKFLFVAFCLALSCHSIPAQKKSFDVQDVIPGGRNFMNYYPFFPRGQFVGKSFVLNGSDSIWVCNGARKSLLASVGQIKSVFENSNVDTPVYGSAVNFNTLDDGFVWNGAGLYTFSLSEGKAACVFTLPDGAENQELNADRSMASFTVGNNLFVADAVSCRKVNTDSLPGVVYGQTVHRSEFGIYKGTFWSPDGRRLAFYRMDESMVDDYPIVDISRRIAAVNPIKYPMAGLTSHEVSVGVYDVQSQQTVYLQTASPVNRYFTNVSWTPDGSQLLVAEINREQNHMWFNVYDALSGKFVRTLFEETDEQWVEPCNPAEFTNNPDVFVWQSERDGFNHLYLYSLSTGKCSRLTKGNWEVSAYYGCSPKGDVFFQATTPSSSLERHIFKVNIKSGKVTALTSGYAVHSALFNSDCSAWVDNMSSVDVARRSTLHLPKNNHVIYENADPYAGFNMPQIKLVDIKSADGLYNLTGRVILPPDFDAGKKYPVIDYVYGGPHSQLVTAEWLAAASTWMLYFAQQGYIVFTMDNRGTDGHGLDFKQAIHRRLGECEMADQMQGIDYLKSLSYVDADRIGVFGWSYGGFMTTSLILNHPETFKVGVAGGPVINWSLYEVMYGERYMDTPAENPDGYAANNLCDKIGNLQGRLLVIHGDIDPVVVWQNSLSLLKSAVDKGVIVDYAVYPGHEHNVMGRDRVHLYSRILRYFNDFLMPEAR